MNQANVEKCFSRLKYNIRPEPRKLKNVKGPEGRIQKIKKTLTALIKYERIELNYPRADETRGYVELLILEALHHGPQDKATMELANFWILEKQLIHKLFKVLVPRFENYTTSFTKVYNAPSIYPKTIYKRAVLELKGNVYPSLEPYNPNQHLLLHNILLDAAKKEFRMNKYNEIATSINSL
ncbi:mitochondrial ribosomal protein L17 [Ptiloglossa arizonensis]|uniref:mitochondrial ribosomal protein L17 n=1 Tax=Ptiloglossa arizonensis TaxID=3350558 RepID=UPI003F9EF351